MSEIDPLTTTVRFSVEVRPVNDNPVSYIALNGQAVGNGRDATVCDKIGCKTDVNCDGSCAHTTPMGEAPHRANECVTMPMGVAPHLHP